MKKYVIIERNDGMKHWEAHKYNFRFKVWGPDVWTKMLLSNSHSGPEECKQKLICEVSGEDKKYKIIEIVEV